MSVFETPWKITTEVKRLLLLPYIRLYFALNGVHWGRKWRVMGCPIIQRYRGSQIKIGQGLVLRSFTSSNPLGPYRSTLISTRSREAVLQIGNNVGITGGTICAEERIEIGNRVLIGANCIIVDTDFHPLASKRRKQLPLAGKYAPVIIEDDVFIGMNSIILKGVHIGCGSVIGAGSVVTSDIQAGAIYAGNPARLVRWL